MKIKILLIAFLVLAVPGCKHKTPLPAGALNQFDADTYNALITAQAAINQAKTTYGSDYYGSINVAIKAYNSALAAYLAWHNAGGGTTGTVQAAISGMLAAVAQMQKASPRPISGIIILDGPEPIPLCYPWPCKGRATE